MTKHIKLKFSIVILLALVLLGGTITLASLSRSTQAASNPFKAGEITTKIEEGEVVVLGETIKKEPKVYNDGPNPAIIRMRVTISPNSIAQIATDPSDLNIQKAITINYKTKTEESSKGYWQYNNSDGFWYYSEIVPAKGSTAPLFTTIKGVTDENNKAKTGMEDFQITLYQEAVQSEAWVEGKPIKVVGETGQMNWDSVKKIWDEYAKNNINK